MELTGRQQEIWSFLVEYVDRHGYPPTVREIGEAVGLASPSTVHAHLANLERAGLLKRDPTKPRALELTGREKPAEPAAAELAKLPLLGQIAAGGPLLAEQNVEDQIAVPETLRGDFVLRVKGESMIDAGILDGDLVIVQRTPGREERRHRRGAGRRRRVGRPGDRQDVLPREGPRAPAAGERVTRADLRRARADPRQGRGGLPDALMSVSSVHRTLEHELFALLRGASLECPVCGEFVLHDGRGRALPRVRDAPARPDRIECSPGRIRVAGRVTDRPASPVQRASR